MSFLSPARLRELSAIFPGEDCLSSAEELAVFCSDASRLSKRPLAVVRPSQASQVQSLMRLASAWNVPLYPRGRASNTVGACLPDPPGIVISTAKLNRILEISSEDFIARVEPGVVTADLQQAVKERGLFYPPDPASLRFCSIGGNVSTAAGGMRAVKYGVTRDYVLGLSLVLASGEIIRTGARTHKNVVGLDLTRLVVGSQGTLGFITEITLKLLPLPKAQATLLAAFESLEACLEGAQAVFASGILPAAMEFMSQEVLEAVAKLAPAAWPESSRAVLLFKLDGTSESVQAEAATLRQALGMAAHFELALTSEAKERLWEPRRLISPASFQVGPNKANNDIAVPRGRFREAVLGAREIGAKLGLAVLVFGHLGDGNLHVNYIYDASDEASAQKARQARQNLLELAVSLDGSISGEHGIGVVKLEYLDLQLGPLERELMRGIKRVFDPFNLLNPGKAY